MDNYVDKIKSAREKVEAEETEYGSPEEQVKAIVLAWLSCDRYAADKVLAGVKTIKGAYKAMENTARNMPRNAGNYGVYMNPEQSTRAIMVYYGVADAEAQKQLEHGLMHDILKTMNRAEEEKYKPYEPGGTVADTTPKMEAKANPATDIPSGNSFAAGLAELSLEDML